MRKASRRLTQLYDRVLDEMGLRSTQYTILYELAINAAEPPTIAELARILAMDRSTLGHNLRPLQRGGLIALWYGGKDRRWRHIVLTRKGKARLHSAEGHWRKAQRRFEDVFGAADTKKLRATLLRIAHDERLRSLDD